MDTNDKSEDFADAVQDRIATLPLLPSVVSQLLALSPDQDDYIDKVNQLAGWDPTLAVRLVEYASRTIKIAGAVEKFQIRQAIARLGTRQVADMVATLALVEAFPAQTKSDRDLWIHSVQVGVFTRWFSVLMPDLKLDSEHAYLTGLLHDIGRFVVFQSVPEGPSRIDELGWSDPLTLIDAEIRVLGTDHVKIGTAACARWGLPQAITNIIALHHTFDLPTETFEQRQTAVRVAIVQMADALSMSLMKHLDQHEPESDNPTENDDEALVLKLQDTLEQVIEYNHIRLPEKYRALLPKQITQLIGNAIGEAQQILSGLGITAGDTEAQGASRTTGTASA